MVRCENCGYELPDEARFCLMCGHVVEPVAASADSATVMGAHAAEHAAANEAENDAFDDEEAAIDTGAFRIPAAKRLEEPISPIGVGAVPMVPATPPRVTRVGARSGRHYAATADRHAGHASSSYQPNPGDYEPSGGNWSYAQGAGGAHALGDTASGEELDEVVTRMKSDFNGMSGKNRRMVAIGLGLAAVLIVVFLVRVSVSWLGPLGGIVDDGGEVQPTSDGSIAALANDDGDSETAGPEARSSVESYSWKELSEIADLITEASTDAEALEIAEAYGLCTKNGKLDGTQTKDLELTDGTEVTMRIVGFRQDYLTGSEKRAGITFIADGTVASKAIDDQARIDQGWEGCTLREWMNDELLAMLPKDLSSVVVEVDKTTNPPAGTGSKQVTTSDKLWIPSLSEIVGEVSSSSRWAGSYTEEGEQYQLFEDEKVAHFEANELLSVNTTDSYWWTRSPDPLSSEHFLCVTTDGTGQWVNHRPATEHAVIMGFCL